MMVLPKGVVAVSFINGFVRHGVIVGRDEVFLYLDDRYDGVVVLPINNIVGIVKEKGD